MYLIFVDESGYQPNWDDEQALSKQPFHVVSAVVIPSSKLTDIYTAIRNRIDQLNLSEPKAEALGKGKEIKARRIDRGEDPWGKNLDLRDEVRKIYLNLDDVTYFVVCIDKTAHKRRYSDPEDPSKLAFQFLFERLQGFLREKEQGGYLLIDLNRGREAEHREVLTELQQHGSSGMAVGFYGDIYEWKLEMKNIVEVHFGDSKYSLGLQVADFVARHAYSWRKNDKNPQYPGWSLIEPRLYKYPNYQGWGYKEFP